MAIDDLTPTTRGGFVDPQAPSWVPDFYQPPRPPRLNEKDMEEIREGLIKKLMEEKNKAEAEKVSQSLVKVSPKKQAFNTITDALEPFNRQEQTAIIRSVLAFYSLGTLED